jgi:sialate O-acetylesterase
MIFSLAEAKIVNNTIFVWSNVVTSPIAVRYAWANNPEGVNLYNKERFPASPFRTDN